MSVKTKTILVILMIAAIFSSHTRKLIHLVSIAVENDAIADPEGGSNGGATCV